MTTPLLAALVATVLLAVSCTERELPAAPQREPVASPEPSAPEPGAPAAVEGAGPAAAAPGDVGSAGAPAGEAREWTAGLVEQRREGLRPLPVLRDVRVGRHPDFDRVVFEFEGTRLPGYRVEYIDRPIIRCGSGEETQLAGEGVLRVRLEPARAHTEEGRATMDVRAMKPGLPVLLELEQVCDFEGQVEWVLGNRGPNRYRVMELRAPSRLVVDVRH